MIIQQCSLPADKVTILDLIEMVEFNLSDKVMGQAALKQLKDMDGMAQIVKIMKKLVEGFYFFKSQFSTYIFRCSYDTTDDSLNGSY